MASRKSVSTFVKSDAFINLTVVLKLKDGTEVPLKAPVWGLNKDNPLHAKLMASPEAAAAAIELKEVKINLARTEADVENLEF